MADSKKAVNAIINFLLIYYLNFPAHSFVAKGMLH